MKLLLIEDQIKISKQLAGFIKGLLSSAEIDIVNSEKDSSAKLLVKKYDLIITDLLLLPENMVLDSGHITRGKSKRERFGYHEWKKYVYEEGGVNILKKLRSSSFPLNTNTFVLVLSHFDSKPGYEKILRMINYEVDKRLAVVPKLQQYTANPIGDPRLNLLLNATKDFFSTLIDGLTNNNLNNRVLDTLAEEIRASIRSLELLKLTTDPLITDKNKVNIERRINSKTKLIIELKNKKDVCLNNFLMGIDCNKGYPLSCFYENWTYLRDYILLNPNISLDFTLEIKEYTSSSSSILINLRQLNSYSDIGIGSGLKENSQGASDIEKMLILRCLLVYLVISSEPLQTTKNGWGVSKKQWCQGSMIDADKLSEQSYIIDGNMAFPQVSEPISIISHMKSIDEGLKVENHIKTLINYIDRAIKDYGSCSITGKDIIVDLQDGVFTGLSGWYFNGDLELRLPKKKPFEPEDEYIHKVGIITTSSYLKMNCMDGRTLGTSEVSHLIEDIYVESKQVDLGEDISPEKISDLLNGELKGMNLLFFIPVGSAQLKIMSTESFRHNWKQKVLDKFKNIKTILALNSDNSVREKELVESLKKSNIFCMFPTRREDTFDTAKVLDYVICSKYRTKYYSNIIGKPFDNNLRNEFFDKFQEIMFILKENDYDGDTMSGSISMRLSDGNNHFVVTTTKTDKSHLERDDLVVVDSYDLLTNEMKWYGTKLYDDHHKHELNSFMPSSSSPWHAGCYSCYSDVKIIVHTHWKGFTYSDKLEEFRIDRYVPSGSPYLAAAICNKHQDLQVSGSELTKFIILKDHGEAFLLEDIAELKGIINMVKEINNS